MIDLRLDEEKNTIPATFSTIPISFVYSGTTIDETFMQVDKNYVQYCEWEASDNVIYWGVHSGVTSSNYDQTNVTQLILTETISAMSQFETATRKFKGFNVLISPFETSDDLSIIDLPTNWYSSTLNSWIGFETAVYGIALEAVWQDLTDISLNKNGGVGGSDSFSVLGTTPSASTIEVPTKDGFTFQGYYDANGVQYIDASGNINQTASLYATIPSELTAKWQSNDITLTLNHTNYADQRYMIYIYAGEDLVMQIMSQSNVITLKLPYIDYTNKKYYIQFVYNSCGSIEYTTLNNVTQVNRQRLQLTTFADTTISYKLNCISLVGIIV